MQMDRVKDRLKALIPTIESICKTSGTPGASIGVLHKGERIWTHHYGYRNVEKKTAPDDQTLYYIASLSKAFTCACINTLVQQSQGKLRWDTPIKDILPTFEQADKEIETHSTLEDWLSHRTGLASKNQMWWTEYGRPSLDRGETLHFTSYLEKVHPFRKRWLYNNWGYGLADIIIEELTGESWGEFLSRHLLKPLGMERTTMHYNTDHDNFAEGYMTLADGTPFHVERPEIEDGKILEGAYAIRSNVDELLTFYDKLMTAASQKPELTPWSPQNPLGNAQKLFQGLVPLEEINPGEELVSQGERSYALGWVVTDLPGSLGVVGLNPTYRKEMPTVGEGLLEDEKRNGERVKCIYHQGSLLSFLSSTHLLPESHTAIVVLTNSMAKNDTADWLGEMLVEAVLDNPHKKNYEAIAKHSAKESVAQWKRMAQELADQKEEDPGPPPRNIEDYVGVYENSLKDWRIEIFTHESADTPGELELRMCFQGKRAQSYKLVHHNYDNFSWLLTRDEDIKEYGRFPMTWLPFYMLHFKTEDITEEDIKKGDTVKEVVSLVWKHDHDWPEGETFERRPRSEFAGMFAALPEVPAAEQTSAGAQT